MCWSESGPISRDENVEIESMCTVVLENKVCMKFVRILRTNGQMLVDKLKRNINRYIHECLRKYFHNFTKRFCNGRNF